MFNSKKCVIFLTAAFMMFNNGSVSSVSGDIVTSRMNIKREGSSILKGNFVKTNLTWNHGKKYITSSSAEQTEGGAVASALGATKDANSTKKKHIYNCKSKVQIGLDVDLGPFHIAPLCKRTFLDVVELNGDGTHKVIWD